MGILFKEGLNVNVIKTIKDNEGRTLSLLCQFNDNFLVNIVCIYAPNNTVKRSEYLANCSQFFVTTHNNRPVTDRIVCGDFNCIDDPLFDHSGQKTASLNTTVGAREFFLLCNQHELHDTQTYLHPNKQAFTHYSKTHKTYTRIDKIFVSISLLHGLKQTAVHHCTYSDHRLVWVELINQETIRKGPGLWVMNNSILKDNSYRKLISDFWDGWKLKKGEFNNLLIWWDIGKKRIKQLSIEYCKEKRRIERTYIQHLKQVEKHLLHLSEQKQLDDMTELIGIQDSIKDFESKELNGARIRAKVQEIEQGERCTSFFVNLEKQKANKKLMQTLLTDDGHLVDTQEEILKETTNFYQRLYKSETTDTLAQDYLLNNLTNVLTDEDRDSVEGEITLEELFTVVNTFSKDKSPGNDGLTAEFYQTFFIVIGKDLVEVINEGFKRGELSLSMRRGVIVLIWKGDDKRLLKNWRPISLLNYDYKAITKVLATRVRDILPKIIHPNQKCGIKGRSIHDGVALIRDIIEYVNRKHLPGVIISLDQTKAYDRVEWEFLFKVLRKFNFGSNFIHMIRTCYTNIESCVKVNGFTSIYFNLSRGIRQGCPISTLLYVLVAETLAEAVRVESEIKGIKLPDGLISKWVGYSDDGNATLSDFKSVEKLFVLLEIYERASGAKVNLQKTQGFLTGKLRYAKDTPLDIRWTNDKIKILGFYFGNTDVSKDNWEPTIAKIKLLLNIWCKRKLTLHGKVTVINSLATSAIWYLSNIISLPEHFAKQIDTIISDFFWYHKKHLISREQLQLPKELGGLGVVNVRLKIKAQRVKFITRLLSGDGDGLWKSLAEHFIGKYKYYNINTDILKCKIINRKVHFKAMPNIYREMLQAWSDLDLTRCTESVQQILHEPLHGNENIPLNITENTLTHYNVKLVRDIWDLRTSDFREFVGLRTNATFRKLYNDIKASLPQQWIRTLKSDDPHDGETDAIFQMETDNILTDVQYTTTKELYTAMLKKTNKDVLCKAKWENLFGDNINWKTIWNTIHSGVIENWDFDVIYKLIHKVIAVRKNLHYWKIVSSPSCLECGGEDSVLHAFFHCKKTKQFIKQAEPLFKKLFGKHFKFNAFKITFGMQYKLGNNASKLGIFLWSKLIKTIWISRKLLEETKPCNEMAIFKTLIKNRLQNEYKAAIEQPERKEKFLSYWCYEGILATCTDTFKLTVNI